MHERAIDRKGEEFMKRFISIGLVVVLAALMAMPVMAKDRLPAPDVRWVWAGERSSGDTHFYCIELGFYPVKGAAEKKGSGSTYASPEAYALKVWVKGDKVPQLNPADWMINLAPTSEQWTRYISGQTAASGALARAKWTFLGLCGYTENQTLRVRLRALEANGRGGKVTKTFKIKLPSYGTFRGLNIRAEMGGGKVFYGEVR